MFLASGKEEFVEIKKNEDFFFFAYAGIWAVIFCLLVHIDVYSLKYSIAPAYP